MIGVLAGFSVLLLATAWISDDAYFTFRTIDNFVNGFGLRWNVAERVQAYTHPLWLIVLTPLYALTRDAFFMPIAVSAALTLVTLWKLARIPSAPTTLVLVMLALACSQAFVDFSTSGLENPLTNLLLVAFFTLYTSSRRTSAVLTLLAALTMVNRQDAALLVLPAWATMVVRDLRPRDYWRHLAGFVPIVAWELFSLFYYGFPFPNTAYAKLKTGIPEWELLQQGGFYFLDSLRRDPVTLTTIAVAALVGLRSDRRLQPIVAGMVSYLAYVTYVGGDFMSGRMYAAPLVSAAVVLLTADAARGFAWRGIAAAVAALALLTAIRFPPAGLAARDGANGIVNERLFYFESSGLRNYTRTREWPSHGGAEDGRRDKRNGTKVIEHPYNGMRGYFAGPGLHIIDTVGLGDPLLARMPAARPWRIGHFVRPVPDGYRPSIDTQTNRIKDPSLLAYYNRLRTITRGPLWDRRRFRVILQWNLGRYDALVAEYLSRREGGV